jgi:hypothetical protein
MRLSEYKYKLPVIDHSKRDHSYADVVKFGDKHQNKHVGDHSYACTVEESGALYNTNNNKSIIPSPQIKQKKTFLHKILRNKMM